MCVVGTGSLLMAVGTHSARAQHLVTDYEAGRLTLDALTAAPPPVRHVVYSRPVHALPTLAHHASAMATVRSRGLVHNIVYHPHAAVHHAAARKARHRT
ncbi:hypothetical protein HLH28_08740 [Gluconacetobacter tumulisoli]|uniref:Uncharacterized protein n=2 Tax=Gluconacetobacter tumulisoli TaxID=1286189 RepID=A0A7W4K770_9PROT|nr:hypothetical protein [Gluconacetobacter tumulisoli]